MWWFEWFKTKDVWQLYLYNVRVCLTLNTFICQRKSQIMLKKNTTSKNAPMFFFIKACKLSVVLFFIISIIWVFIFKWIVSRDFRGLQMIQWTEHKRLVLAVLQYIGYGYTRITKYFYFYKHFYQGDVPPSNVQKKQSEFC